MNLMSTYPIITHTLSVFNRFFFIFNDFLEDSQMKQWKVGIIGATGMVGQRFATLLDGHPWFQVVALGSLPSFGWQDL